MDKTAVLLMAYGTPNSLEEVEPYYTDIRGGRKPSPELLAELTERYAQVGGRTPLLDISKAQAQGLQDLLGDGYRTYIGMKHWHPYLAEAVEQIRQAGHSRVIAMALAPHYSRFSIDGYVQRVRDAMTKTGATFEITFVESWNDEPLYIQSVAERMEQTRTEFKLGAWSEIQVVFTAHSLPERILQSGDPYPEELRETAELVAKDRGLAADGWRFSFQSAGRTGEKWLGPDILDTLDALAAEGKKCVLIVPIGFVADHLEILFDIDIECVERARELGIEMHRTTSANATPTFERALAAVVKEHL